MILVPAVPTGELLTWEARFLVLKLKMNEIVCCLLLDLGGSMKQVKVIIVTYGGCDHQRYGATCSYGAASVFELCIVNTGVIWWTTWAALI